MRTAKIQAWQGRGKGRNCHFKSVWTADWTLISPLRGKIPFLHFTHLAQSWLAGEKGLSQRIAIFSQLGMELAVFWKYKFFVRLIYLSPLQRPNQHWPTCANVSVRPFDMYPSVWKFSHTRSVKSMKNAFSYERRKSRVSIRAFDEFQAFHYTPRDIQISPHHDRGSVMQGALTYRGAIFCK